MSTSDRHPQSLKSRLTAMVILFALGFGFMAAGFVANITVVMEFVRGADGKVMVTGSNHFTGWKFFSKTIGPVTETAIGSGRRDRLGDTQKERRRQERRKHVSLIAENGDRLGWDRENDKRQIDDFLRSAAPSMTLIDAAPWWRVALSWFGLVLGLLTFIGALQNLNPNVRPPEVVAELEEARRKRASKGRLP